MGTMLVVVVVYIIRHEILTPVSLDSELTKKPCPTRFQILEVNLDPTQRHIVIITHIKTSRIVQ
jgi:hypothetical protein